MFERNFKPRVKPGDARDAARRSIRPDSKAQRDGERKLTTAEILDILQKSRARLRKTAIEEGLIAQ